MQLIIAIVTHLYIIFFSNSNVF